MASVYKRTRRKPIPEDAEIIHRNGKRFATWTNSKTGRKHRVPLSEDGNAAVVTAGTYTVEYFDQQGVRRPLRDHLADFQAYLIDKQDTLKHVRMTCCHITWVVDHCHTEHIGDLNGPAVMEAIGDLREMGSSLRTCNAYLASVKSFSRWLWKHKRTPDDPLCVLGKFNEETDRRHVRRELTAEELPWLIAVTERYTAPRHALPGPDRAMAYRLAVSTGLRASELRSLTPSSFDLHGDPPTVTVLAAYSKRRRTDCQPIRRDFAEMLREWLAARPADKPVFGKLPGSAAQMLRRDLARARAEWIEQAKTDREREARGKVRLPLVPQ